MKSRLARFMKLKLLLTTLILYCIKNWKRMACRWNSILTINYLIIHGVKLNSKKCNFNGRTYLSINKNSKVVIGDYFVANSGIEPCIGCDNDCKIVVQEHAALSIGEYSGMTNSIIQYHEKIVIGNYVNIRCRLFNYGF